MCFRSSVGELSYWMSRSGRGLGASALLAASMAAWPAAGAQVREPETELPAAAEEPLDGMLLTSVPIDLPGQEEGARSKPKPAPVVEKGGPLPLAERDWFGGKSIFDWQHVTGDWGGLRTTLSDHGINFAGSFNFDYAAVLSGPGTNKPLYLQLLDVNLTVDTEALWGHKGGTIFIDFYSSNRNGEGSPGDAQGFSNFGVDKGLDQIAQFWYEQRLLGDMLRVKAGKIDANAEFGFVGNAGDFIRPGATLTAANPVMPTMPDPATGVVLFVYPTEWLYAGFGFFDGASHAGPRTGERGPSTFFSDSKNNDWYFIGEAGLTAKKIGPFHNARIAAGGWGHTGEFDRFDGSSTDGARGFYAVAEAMIWKTDPENEDDTRGLNIFCLFGHDDDDLFAIGNHYGFGASLQGTFSGRDHDAIGAFVSIADMSDAPGAEFDSDETALEFYYKLQLTPWITVTPDLQVIVNPNGDSSADTAVIAAMRVSVSF